MFRKVVAKGLIFQKYTNLTNYLNYHQQQKHLLTCCYSTIASKTTDEFVEQDKIEASLFGNIENEFKPITTSTETLLNEYNKEKSSTSSTKKRNKIKLNENKIHDKSLGLSYFKLDRNDPVLHKIILSARSNKYREKHQHILIEGNRLIDEALTCEFPLKTIIFSRKEQLELIKEKVLCSTNAEPEIYKVAHHDLKLWSSLNTPPGLIGIFTKPINPNTKIINALNEQRLPITVICDNIREPNNLGSIIRSCAALPCKNVLILKGCCNPWETKALRGGCGGQFRIHIEHDLSWDDIELNLLNDSEIFVAENNLQRMIENKITIRNYTQIENSKNNILIIGGETHGISDEAYRFLMKKKGSGIHIPLADGINSLNTAAALTLILFQMKQKYLPG